MVVRDLGRYLLVNASSDQVARMTGSGLQAVILDEISEASTYYTVSFRVPDQATWLDATATRILRSDGRDAVIAATAAEAQLVSDTGLDIAKVFMRPIRIAPTRKPDYSTEQAAKDVADPVVAELVAGVGFMAVDNYVQRLQAFQTRYATHDSCQAAADWIESKFRSFGIDSVYTQSFSSQYKDNVVAVIPGASHPEKVVVIGGHYDSTTSNHNFCPGADDDASGTACVIECARLMNTKQFEYTVKFVAFGAEEQGLIGSEAFAAAAASAGEEIVGAIAVDMIGYVAPGDTRDLDIIDNGSSQWMRDLVGTMSDLYVSGLPVVDGALPFGASSDHASFWAHGYDAILFFEDTGDYSPYIHSADDIVGVSYNSSTMARQSTQLAVALVATMARPFRISIAHEPLTNTTDSGPYHVVADVASVADLAFESLLVHYSTGGSFAEMPLAETGTPGRYEAYLPGQSSGTFVDYYLTAANVDGDQALHPNSAPDQVHRFFVGEITPMLVHDFESDQGWTVGAAGDDATTGIWERVNPNGTSYESGPVQPEDDHTADPGVLCWVTGNAPAGSGQGENDVDGGRTTLLSPLFDLSAHQHAGLRYHRWYTNNTGGSPGQDLWQVDVSNDDGQTWVNVESTSNSLRSWQEVDVELSALLDLTDQMRFRFIASDEGDGSVVEAAVDDFVVLSYADAVSAADDALPAVLVATLGQNHPNPFNPTTSISFILSKPTQASLRVFDLSGRLVRVLMDEQALESGSHSVTWNGTDGRGRQVATGVYFYRLDTPETSGTRRMVLLK